MKVSIRIIEGTVDSSQIVHEKTHEAPSVPAAINEAFAQANDAHPGVGLLCKGDRYHLALTILAWRGGSPDYIQPVHGQQPVA